MNIEVTISPILRAMVAGRPSYGSPGRSDLAAPPIVQHRKSAVRRRIAAWESVSLRRDGARPIRFDGLTVLNFAGEVEVKGVTCFQSVSLFTSDTRATYLSLVCQVSQGEHIRSLHKAARMDNADIGTQLAAWCGDICNLAAFVTRSSPDAITLSHVHDAFQSITSHCFLPKQLP